MKYSLEERMEIGRRMYEKEIDFHAAMQIYGISESCAHKYMTDYKRAHNLPLSTNSFHNFSKRSKSKKKNELPPNMEAYMSMTKEELINELILAKANELRAKKGYGVKGAGASKEFVSLSNKNMK